MQRKLKPFGLIHAVEGRDEAISSFSTSAFRISVPVGWCALALLLMLSTSSNLVSADIDSGTLLNRRPYGPDC